MFVCLTSFNNNLGQTVTSINLTALLSKLMDKEILIIDTDNKYRGIEKYLSNSNFCKGLDEFVNFKDTGMLDNEEVFKNCVKEVTSKIHIMASNQCTNLSYEDIKALKYYTNKVYPLTIVDTVKNSTTKKFLDYCDLLVVVLNQNRKSVLELLESNCYKPYKDKTIFVVNKYITKLNDEKIYYTKEDIIKDLSKNDYSNNEIFTLDFDASIINESNDFTILNSINMNTSYSIQLENLSKHILAKYLGYSFDEEENEIKVSKGGMMQWVFIKRLLRYMK